MDQSFYGSSYQFQPNVILGIGHGLEASIDAESVNNSGADVNAAVGLKWRFYNSDKLALYVGDKVYFPNAGNYFYTAGAYLAHGFRFTAGAWNSQNAVASANHSGAILGIERPVSVGKLTITPAADWQNGRGTNGLLTAGVMFITKHWLLTPAYQRSNLGGQGAVLYAGYYF